MRTDDVGLRRIGARADHRAPLDGCRRAPDDRRRRLAAARMRREGDVTDLRAALLHPRCSPVGISRCRHSPARTIPPISESAAPDTLTRSEEHTSELQSLMRISYAVFCW